MGTDRPIDYDESISQTAGDRSAQVLQIDMGKGFAAMLVCAVISGICATISFTVWRSAHDDSVDIQDQYQKERNHVIELEARLKILGDEVQHMKESRR